MAEAQIGGDDRQRRRCANATAGVMSEHGETVSSAAIRALIDPLLVPAREQCDDTEWAKFIIVVSVSLVAFDEQRIPALSRYRHAIANLVGYAAKLRADGTRTSDVLLETVHLIAERIAALYDMELEAMAAAEDLPDFPPDSL